MVAIVATQTSDFSNAVRAHSLGAADAIAVILLMVAVSVVTWLITASRGRHALLDRMFEQAPPTAVLNAASRVVRVNREFSYLFGYAPHEAFGRPLVELIVPPQSREEFQRQAELVAQGQRVDAEAVRQRKDGSLLHVLVVTVPVSAPDGQVSVYAMHRDITKRKAAEIALQALSSRLMAVQETERRRLALELHDEIGQLLTGLRLLLRCHGELPPDAPKDRLERARDIVDDLLDRVRGLSFDLRPACLDELGLLPALLALFERFSGQTGVQVNFKHQGIQRRFPSQVETVAYRVVQEGLTNVARHAGVTGVTVRIWVEAERLNLQIEDRGVGFDPEVVMKEPRSSGLIGMRERTSFLGGRMSVESSAGCGTTIAAELPLDDRRQGA